MMPLSTLIKNWQAQATDAVNKQLDTFKPDWVTRLQVIQASTHRIDLIAMIEGSAWTVILTPSFHGIHVKVEKGNNPKTQARLSKDLALRLNN